MAINCRIWKLIHFSFFFFHKKARKRNIMTISDLSFASSIVWNIFIQLWPLILHLVRKSCSSVQHNGTIENVISQKSHFQSHFWHACLNTICLFHHAPSSTGVSQARCMLDMVPCCLTGIFRDYVWLGFCLFHFRRAATLAKLNYLADSSGTVIIRLHTHKRRPIYKRAPNFFSVHGLWLWAWLNLLKFLSRILYSSEALIHGFWGSKIIKWLVGRECRIWDGKFKLPITA